MLVTAGPYCYGGTYVVVYRHVNSGVSSSLQIVDVVESVDVSHTPPPQKLTKG